MIKINKKNVQDEELPHELFLSTKQATKIRNSFANNISTDIKLSITQFGGSFDSWLTNLGKKALTNVAIPLARDKFFCITKQYIFKCNKWTWKKIKCKRSCESKKRSYFVHLGWTYEWYNH